MEKDKFTPPAGAKRLSPMEMNRLAILKDHTVITFTEKPDPSQKSGK